MRMRGMAASCSAAPAAEDGWVALLLLPFLLLLLLLLPFALLPLPLLLLLPRGMNRGGKGLLNTTASSSLPPSLSRIALNFSRTNPSSTSRLSRPTRARAMLLA
jgi:hypothetical protein